MNADSWRVRITAPDGHQLGGGVLISDNIVLTCAHIFTDAGIHPPLAEAGVRATFPFSSSGSSFELEAMPEGWFPAVQPEDGGDIAVLRLIGDVPAGVVPAPLASVSGRHGATVAVFGGEDDMTRGRWVSQRLGRAAGPNAEWLQLDGADGASAVRSGFSGGGIVHTGSGTDVEPVIGLVVAAGVGRAGHLSWMIPLDVVARYWRPLAGLMQGERRAGAQDDAAVGDRLVRALAGLHSVRDRGTLRRIVELLPDVVRMELGARAGTPSVDEIVEVCRRWSGGLRDLIHTVAYFERDINGGRQDLTDGIITEFGGHDLQPERPPARYSGALQPEHRKLLVNALRGFERLRSPVARRVFLEMLVDDVSEGSGARLSIEVSADLVVDIHEIVNKCHGIPGAPQKMLAILRNFCDDERPALDNLALQIGTVYLEALLTDAERAAILGLLRDLPVEVLDRAYAQCLPAFALRQGGPLAAGDYLRQVERMTAPDGLPRVIVFAEHVAGRAETVRGPLRAWSDRLAIRMRIVRDQIEDLRRGIVVGDEAPEPSYLVCRITPDGVDPHQYVYSATIQIGSGPARALASSDDAADLATTKTKIGSTLKTVPRELNYNLDALTVELVLPRSLLTEPVDQWQFRDTQPYVLGQRRRLVIRSYERMSSDRDDLWPQWFEKWRAVEDQMTTGTHVMVFTADSGAMAEPDIRRLSSPDVTLLALGRPPYERADLETPDAITAALSEGVPFVIWCRDGKLSTEFRRTLETFLHHKPVRDLPNQVFRWRRQTDEAGDDVARFAGELSLVACDATRGSHVALRYLNSPRRG